MPDTDTREIVTLETTKADTRTELGAGSPDETALRRRIKEVLIESLSLEGMTPENIEDSAPLFGDEGLGLDSVDALELMVVFEKDFGLAVDIDEVGVEAFATVANMAELIRKLAPEGAGTT